MSSLLDVNDTIGSTTILPMIFCRGYKVFHDGQLSDMKMDAMLHKLTSMIPDRCPPIEQIELYASGLIVMRFEKVTKIFKYEEG